MKIQLDKFLSLNGKVTRIDEDSFIYSLFLSNDSIEIIRDLHDANFIEQLLDDKGVIIGMDRIASFENKTVDIEVVTSELKKHGFYLKMNDCILANRFGNPSQFYIHDIAYLSTEQGHNERLEKYRVISMLINILVTKAKFISEEHVRTICLVQENSFIEIPIETFLYEDMLDQKNVLLIDKYIDDVNSYKEKRTIFIKELIDFLSVIATHRRFSELIIHFEDFYNKCNTSFEYYLANFSFNKVKLELDTSVLEYSKNIRAIINESQSKLIAIPAGFILGVSQIDYDNPFFMKNILIVLSGFLFSYIISIFIINQKNAIEIISDNLKNFKSNYSRSKATYFEDAKELSSLMDLIKDTYLKIEIEISEQKKRLRIFQFCSWGISVGLFVSILFVSLSQECWSWLCIYSYIYWCIF